MVRPLDRPGTPSTLDHRPRFRQAAAGQRNRQRSGGFQRRDLQLPRVEKRSAGTRSPLRHANRHGSHRAPLRGVRRRLPGPPERDVRTGRLGCVPASVAAGPGPDGTKATGLSQRARSPAVRQRTESAAAGSRGSSRTRPHLARRISHLPVRSAPSHHAGRLLQAAASPQGRLPGRPIDGTAILETGIRGTDSRPQPSRLAGGVTGNVDRGRASSFEKRRPAGCVPLGRD